MLYYFYSLTLRGLDISTSLLGVLNIHIRHLTTLLAKKKNRVEKLQGKERPYGETIYM